MFAPTQFGALPLPAPAATSESPTSGDPGLDVLLAFAKAVIVDSASTVYTDIAPGTGAVVQQTRAHNPGQVEINEKDFPALYGWRVRGDTETLADDYEIETCALSLLWVFPTAKAEHQAKRNPLVNAVAKPLLAGLKRGRHPAWVVDNDPDALAASQGSFLWSWAGWWAFQKASWKLQEVVVQKIGVDATYPALQWEITVQERVSIGLPTDPAKSLNTLDAGGDGAAVIFRMPL